MNRRGTIRSLPALAALLCAGATGARADNINVRLNGEPVYFEGTQPHEVNGRVLVPLRGVLEKMGASVDWMQDSQTVVATRGNTEIDLPIGSRTARINGQDVTLDVPAMTLGGRTMVPLRFVSQALGADVTWSASTQTVMIDTGGRRFNAYRNRPRNDNDQDRDRNRPQEYRRTSAVRWMVLPAGTVIPVTLDEPLSSDGNSPDDRFTATVRGGQDNPGLPDGTKIRGVVREAIPARNGKPGVLDVDFTRIELPDGTTRPLDGNVISLNSKNITHDSEGRLQATSNRGNERLKWVGIGAGAGLLIGTIAKGNALVDTLLGAGAGYLYNELQHKGAGNVHVDAGTEIGVRLNQRLAFSPNAP